MTKEQAENLFDEIHDLEAKYFLENYNMQSFELVREKILEILVSRVELPVKPEIAGVEIHLNESTDKTIRVFSEHSNINRELDFLIGMMVIRHTDHLEIDNKYLYEVMVRVYNSKKHFIITVG